MTLGADPGSWLNAAAQDLAERGREYRDALKAEDAARTVRQEADADLQAAQRDFSNARNSYVDFLTSELDNA